MDSDPAHGGRDALRLMHELDAMPERQLLFDLRSLDVSLYIYTRNYLDLRSYLEFVRRDPANHDLWHMTAIAKKQDIRREISRLLQNYVAAVKSLVDHTRELTRHLYGENAFPGYREKVDAVFSRDGLVQFVQRLRNILLHCAAAPIVFHGKMVDEGQPAANEVGLDVEAVRRQKKWLNPQALAYLATCEKTVDLPSLIDAYHSRVATFYEWFDRQQQEMHAEELHRLAVKESEYFLLQIADALDSWLANPDATQNPAPSDRGLFMGIFDISEFRLLESLPPGSTERAETALAMLANYFTVSDDLERKIRSAYSNPDFFKFDAFRQSSEAGM